MKIWIATCERLREGCTSDALLLESLASKGVEVEAKPWTELVPQELKAAAGSPPSNLVIIRTTWDYIDRLPEFLAWIDELEGLRVPVLNPPAVLKWNTNKKYLRDAEAAGVTIPDTVWLEGHEVDEATVRTKMSEKGWARAVLKPCVSANSFGTSLITPEGPFPTTEELGSCTAPSGAILQAYIEEITTGELSFIMVDGKVSHVVRKVPAEGEFRVQERFGGEIAAEADPVPPTVVKFAELALKTSPEPTLYGRVDVVVTASGPVLMELELVEPEMFNQCHLGSADLFADAILARVRMLEM